MLAYDQDVWGVLRLGPAIVLKTIFSLFSLVYKFYESSLKYLSSFFFFFSPIRSIPVMSLVASSTGSGRTFRLASLLILTSLGLAKALHIYYQYRNRKKAAASSEEEEERKKSAQMNLPVEESGGGEASKAKQRSSSEVTVGSVDSGTTNWNDLVEEEELVNEIKWSQQGKVGQIITRTFREGPLRRPSIFGGN